MPFDVTAVEQVQILKDTFAGRSAMPTTCRLVSSRPSTDIISYVVRS